MENGKIERIKTHKSIVISFRITKEQAARIDEASGKMRVKRTRSDWSRAAVLYMSKQKVPYPVKIRKHRLKNKSSYDIEVLSRILGQIGKIGSNLNQIAKYHNKTKSPNNFDNIDKIINDISDIKKIIVSKLA